MVCGGYPQLEKNKLFNSLTKKGYLSSKIPDTVDCKRYLYFHPSVEYQRKMRWQRNMCREHLGTFFSDMIRENDKVKVVVFGSSGSSRDSSAKTNQRFQGVFGCAYRRDASKICWLEVTHDS